MAFETVDPFAAGPSLTYPQNLERLRLNQLELIDRSSEVLEDTGPLLSTTGSVTFDNIPQDYRHLVLRGNSASTSTTGGADSLRARINSDIATDRYVDVINFLESGGLNRVAGVRDDEAVVGATMREDGTGGSQFCAVEAYIFDYSNSNLHTTGQGFGGSTASLTTNRYFTSHSSFRYRTSTPVERITLRPRAGSFHVDTWFMLLGVR